MSNAELLALRRTLDRSPDEVLKRAQKAANKERQDALFQLRKLVHDKQRAARPMQSGNINRLWLQCPKCGHLQYRDYIPYSLANPILVPGCAHGRYEDLIEIVTIEQRVGKDRVKWVWVKPKEVA